MQNNDKLNAIEGEIERLGAVISAAEDWSPLYFKDKTTQAKLLRQEASFETLMRKYLRELAGRAHLYVNWLEYTTQAIKAFEVNVIVTDDALAEEEGILINFVYDPVAAMVATGGQAGEAIYKLQAGITSSQHAVVDAARKQAATLVKQVNETTRARLRQSLATSLELGEDNNAAVDRLRTILNDPKRAATIVRTESVRAYQNGLDVMAEETGAVGAEWQAIATAIDHCKNLDGVVVKIGETFPGTDVIKPPLHVNCRCGRRLIYPVEVERNPNIFS